MGVNTAGRCNSAEVGVDAQAHIGALLGMELRRHHIFARHDGGVRRRAPAVHDDCDGALAATGLRFVSVEHRDNAQRSIEEANRLGQAYRALLGRPWVNQKGERHPITTDDILVVSPYNMQVNLLKQTLPPGARVGTVDKFQGQEAAAVLVSMASSSADDAPRGIDFLFSRNRLNVALSRARCLSVIFCSPALLDVVCADLERMKLVNTVCWAKEYARG